MATSLLGIRPGGPVISPVLSVPGGKARVEQLADLERPLAGEAAARHEVGDRPEVPVLSAGQAPVEHRGRGVADVLEAMHRVAGYEDHGAGTRDGGLAADRER